MSKQLADLFKLSLTTGVFSSALKTAKVVPAFKEDLKLDYSNYHPISLLSNIEKILEKLMYKRLYTFQFGFRQQYSTSHALINITENIRKALDDGNIGPLLFLLYINDIDQAIKCCKVPQFADDTSPLYLSN